MSAALKQYSKCTVWLDGKLLSEEVGVAVKASSGLIPIDTVVNGFSGFSKGSEKITVSIEAVVPTDGFEFFPNDMPLGKTINCTVFCGSKTLSMSAGIIDYNFSHSVDASVKFSMDLMCQYAEMQ